MLDLTTFEKAISSLGKAVDALNDESFSDYSADLAFIIKSGVVQHFEFTYELCWKYMKRILNEIAGTYLVEGLSRKELFRMAAEYKLIDDPIPWFAYHAARNITSHTYNQSIADEVAGLALPLYNDSLKLLEQLKKKNA